MGPACSPRQSDFELLDLSARISQILITLLRVYAGDKSVTIESFDFIILLLEPLDFTFVESLEVA